MSITQVSTLVVSFHLSLIISFYRISCLQSFDTHGPEEERRVIGNYEGCLEEPSELQEFHGMACIWPGVSSKQVSKNEERID